jgi:hypothetical protein
MCLHPRSFKSRWFCRSFWGDFFFDKPINSFLFSAIRSSTDTKPFSRHSIRSRWLESSVCLMRECGMDTRLFVKN